MRLTNCKQIVINSSHFIDDLVTRLTGSKRINSLDLWRFYGHIQPNRKSVQEVHITDNFEQEVANIATLSRGDVRVFSRLYARYHELIHSNILKLENSPEASAEVRQDVFLSLWQHRDRIRTDRPLGGWLFVVSYNRAFNRLRKDIKDSLVFVNEYPADSSSCESDCEAEERVELRMQLLDEAVSELPKHNREVFCMCRYEGRSKKDIVDRLGLCLRTVENYLKDANRMIKKYLCEKHPEHIGKLSATILTLYFL